MSPTAAQPCVVWHTCLAQKCVVWETRVDLRGMESLCGEEWYGVPCAMAWHTCVVLHTSAVGMPVRYGIRVLHGLAVWYGSLRHGTAVWHSTCVYGIPVWYGISVWHGIPVCYRGILQGKTKVPLRMDMTLIVSRVCHISMVVRLKTGL